MTLKLESIFNDPGVQTAISQMDANLENLCRRCVDIAGEILQLSKSLAIGSKSSMFLNLKQVLKSIWKEDKLRALNDGLAALRSEIELNLLVDLR